jgi:uncharacterized membrane protein
MKMTNKKIIAIALSVAIMHFVLASVIGHYIAVEIGTKMGGVVANGLKEGIEGSKLTDDEAARFYRDMKNKGSDIVAKWRAPLLLLSLPVEPVLRPFLREITKKQINMVVSKKISREQLYTQNIIIDYTVRLINSAVLGLLLYIAMRIWNRRAKYNTGRDLTGHKFNVGSD